jgi:hypothetical protein
MILNSQLQNTCPIFITTLVANLAALLYTLNTDGFTPIRQNSECQHSYARTSACCVFCIRLLAPVIAFAF